MKKLLFTFTILIGIATISFIISGYTTSDKTSIRPKKILNHGFVIMELFTSQGCSSCPPADEVLGKYVLQNNPNVIPLAFHVDYWDYIGWKDPFANPKFSERQRIYANVLKTNNYTPQLIINGKYELVGSKENSIEKLVQQELNATSNGEIDLVATKSKDNTIKVSYTLEGANKNDFLNIALVKKMTLTNIKRGENSGLKLTNYNVVTDFINLSLNNKNANEVRFNFDENWNSSDFIVVAYLQKTASGKIFGATKSEIK